MSTAMQRRPGISPAALLAVKGGSPNTQAAYRRGVSLFISWAGDRTLSARLFSEWIEELRKAGVPASTLRQRLCGGKAAIMQAATEAGMEPRAWQALKTALDSIKGEREASPEIRVLDGKERARLLAAMNERNRLVARFLYATAARISEALGVKESDIVPELATARIRLHGKGRKERVGRIPLELLEQINTTFHHPGRVYLFECRPGRRMNRTAMANAIAEAGKQALGRTVSPHDLRHSRATDLFARTGNLKGVSDLLGHANVNVTARYYVKTQLTSEELWKGEEI
jgi:integrase/recombinase XerD